MTNKEAIKYLHQLYPNGGHCWLDEQRIEAISMAIKALQKESVSEEQVKESLISKHDDKTCKENGNSLTQESVSKDLEEVGKEWLKPQLDKSYANYGEAKMMELTHFDGYAMLDAIEFGANWQKQKDSIPVSEDLESLVRNYREKYWYPDDIDKFIGFAKQVANWQKQQLMAKAVDGVVVCNNLTHGFKDIVMEIPSFLNVDDEVKVIVIKEE